MATLTIRKLDSTIKSCLRIQAAQHGISMEEEARRLLRKALIPKEVPNRLGSIINQHFIQTGGVDENIIPPRSMPRSTLDLHESDR